MTHLLKRFRTRTFLQDAMGATALMAMLYAGLLLPGF